MYDTYKHIKRNLEFRFKKGTRFCLGFWRDGKKDEEASKDYEGKFSTLSIIKTRFYKKV